MSNLVYSSTNVALFHGDCIESMRQLSDASIDAVVTDPPYELGFMGKGWDGAGIAYSVDLWRECLRVLKPGGYLLSFGGTRTYHRMTVAIEDAGFEIRDSIHWMYGSGFPKSMDVSKAFDKAAGVEREIVGVKPGHENFVGRDNHPLNDGWDRPWANDPEKVARYHALTAPATDLAKKWSGWGTALKPAHEPVVVARKPLVGTVAANVERYGTGAINVDACRVGSEVRTNRMGTPGANSVRLRGDDGRDADNAQRYATANRSEPLPPVEGRWPPNVLFSHAPECVEGGAYDVTCPVAELDRQSGGASRFFPVFRYEAKAARKEREEGTEGLPVRSGAEAVEREEGSAGVNNPRAGAGRTAKEVRNHHPTVKPVDLMRWLVRLVTPPGGVVLDPFTGSGTTGVAVIREGFKFVGCEREDDYVRIAQARIDSAVVKAAEAAKKSA